MSGKLLRGRAMELIAAGAYVLCRNFEVRNSPPETANAIAKERPKWEHRWHGTGYEEGDFLVAEPIEGLGGRDLAAIANGPIMEPLRLYLPAGKLSEAEYQERLALDFKRAGIEP